MHAEDDREVCTEELWKIYLSGSEPERRGRLSARPGKLSAFAKVRVDPSTRAQADRAAAICGCARRLAVYLQRQAALRKTISGKAQS